MMGRASVQAVFLAMLNWHVVVAHVTALRARQQNEASSHMLQMGGGSLLNRGSLRTAMMKTLPLFDMNAGTFLSLVSAIPTDRLLLFFSPTCPDCEQLAPQWSRVTAEFEDNEDLTILGVSDDAGRAPAPYTHDENPAIFFIPKGDSSNPISFPVSYLHEFAGLPETGNTEDAIVNRIITFARSHMTAPSTATAPAVAAEPAAAPPPGAPTLSEAQTGTLVARLLMSLKAKENQPLEEQLKIVYEPHYSALPVVQFLKSPSGMLGPALVTIAAQYLDGLPLAQKWANEYAATQVDKYRKTGWTPTSTEEQSYFQDLLNYAIPLYARSIYFQRGLKR